MATDWVPETRGYKMLKKVFRNPLCTMVVWNVASLHGNGPRKLFQ